MAKASFSPIDLQAVVLAGGEGSLLLPLSASVPKAFLPIGNRPMIWYCLQNLFYHRIFDILIVAQKSLHQRLEAFLYSECSSFNGKAIDISKVFDIAVLPENYDEAWGTADCLSYISPKLKDTFFLLSCDAIGYLDLSLLAEIHFSGKAACTVLLVDNSVPSKSGKAKNGAFESNENAGGTANAVWVCLNEATKSLLSIKDSIEISHADAFELSQLQLYWNPNILLRTDMVDMHVYLMNTSILTLLKPQNKMAISSIRYDLVPYLAAMQNTPKAFEWSGKDYSASLENLETGVICAHHKEDRFTYSNPPEIPKEGHSVLFLIQTPGNSICCRANNLKNYTTTNLQLCVSKRTELSTLLPEWLYPISNSDASRCIRDSIVALGVIADATCSVKKSVIGSNTVIEGKVKVANTVVLQDVTIREGARLNNCIICPNAEIGSNCKLSNCYVSKGYKVSSNTEAENAFLPSFESDILS